MSADHTPTETIVTSNSTYPAVPLPVPSTTHANSRATLGFSAIKRFFISAQPSPSFPQPILSASYHLFKHYSIDAPVESIIYISLPAVNCPGTGLASSSSLRRLLQVLRRTRFLVFRCFKSYDPRTGLPHLRYARDSLVGGQTVPGSLLLAALVHMIAYRPTGTARGQDLLP